MVLATAPQQAPQHQRGLPRGFPTRITAAITSGVTLAFSAPPGETAWLLPISVAILVLVLRSGGIRSGALIGYAFGAAYLLVLTGWMRAVGTDAWLMIGLAAAGFYAVLGAAIAAVRETRGWPLWTACLWVSMETAMSTWPLGGFPWTRLAWATIDTPLASWSPWLGVTGVSFIAALLGTLLAWLVLNVRRRPKLAGGVALTAGIISSLPTVLEPASLGDDWVKGRPETTVAVVQGGVPGRGNDVVAVHREVTANHVTATADLADRVRTGDINQPDFVLWPENSTAVDPFNDAATRSGIETAVASIDAPILVGAIVDGPRTDAVLNQGLVWTPDGRVDSRYTKQHPVPFGEYIPLRRWLTGLQIGRLDMIPRDMIRGTSTAPLSIGEAVVADVICFDIAFDNPLIGQVRRGAQLITVQTSNATFIDTTQPEQQFAITRLRAMETGRFVAVAAVNGISAVIRPDGTVQQILPQRATGTMVEPVALIERRTPATRLGNGVTIAMLLAAAGALSATAHRGIGTAREHKMRKTGAEQ